MMMDEPKMTTNLFNEGALEDLAALLTLFKKLRDTLIDDRQQWASIGGDMAQLVEMLAAENQRLQALIPHIKDELIACLQQASHQAAQEMVYSLGLKLTQTLDQAMGDKIWQLDQAVQHARQQIERSERQLGQAKWWLLGIGIAASLLGGMAGGGLVRRSFPAESFTAIQHQQLMSGDILHKAWPGLTKAEQDKIMALARGETPENPSASPEVKAGKKK